MKINKKGQVFGLILTLLIGLAIISLLFALMNLLGVIENIPFGFTPFILLSFSFLAVSIISFFAKESFFFSISLGGISIIFFIIDKFIT